MCRAYSRPGESVIARDLCVGQPATTGVEPPLGRGGGLAMGNAQLRETYRTTVSIMRMAERRAT
jgi:hypothetical protein